MKMFFIFSLVSYMLLISSGVVVSHVYCAMGERWIVGSEMPTPKFSLNKCSKLKKEKNSRQKDTYKFNFEIDSKSVSKQELIIANNLINIVYVSYSELVINDNNIESQTNSNSRFKPKLSILQIFRI